MALTHPGRRRATASFLAAALALVTGGLVDRASAAFETGVAGGQFTATDPEVRDQAFDRVAEVGGGIVRISLSWRAVTTGVPADAASPTDPAYDFDALDAAAADAAERGIELMLTFYAAPEFAEGPNRPAEAFRGTWKPDPGEFGAFARAVATRYSGEFMGLPRIRYFEAWNEPNLREYLAPQWKGSRPASPGVYRRLLNAFEDGVHAAHPDNVVIAGGTAPYGDDSGPARVRPLRFIRDLLCLKERRGKLKRDRCRDRASFDVLSHHPINTSGGPRRSAIHPDDASTPDFKHVRRTLRAAERKGTVRGRHALWATEIWWESNPPDTVRGVPVEKHADYLQEALYLLWKQGADAVINLSLRDGPFDPENPGAQLEAGLLYEDGSPKPAFAAWRFPFVVDRGRKSKRQAWGRSPVSGQVEIQRQKGDAWQTVERTRVQAGEVFTERVRVRRNSSFRATVGAESSLVWKARK